MKKKFILLFILTILILFLLINILNLIPTNKNFTIIPNKFQNNYSKNIYNSNQVLWGPPLAPPFPKPPWPPSL